MLLWHSRDTCSTLSLTPSRTQADLPQLPVRFQPAQRRREKRGSLVRRWRLVRVSGSSISAITLCAKGRVHSFGSRVHSGVHVRDVHDRGRSCNPTVQSSMLPYADMLRDIVRFARSLFVPSGPWLAWQAAQPSSTLRDDSGDYMYVVSAAPAQGGFRPVSWPKCRSLSFRAMPVGCIVPLIGQNVVAWGASRVSTALPPRHPPPRPAPRHPPRNPGHHPPHFGTTPLRTPPPASYRNVAREILE